MDLRGRGALVTGGSGDLGAAACEALARAGCDVAVGYHSRSFHGTDDPTSAPTAPKGRGHIEVIAAHDNSPPPRPTAGTDRPPTMKKLAKVRRGERGDVV